MSGDLHRFQPGLVTYSGSEGRRRTASPIRLLLFRVRRLQASGSLRQSRHSGSGEHCSRDWSRVWSSRGCLPSDVHCARMRLMVIPLAEAVVTPAFRPDVAEKVLSAVANLEAENVAFAAQVREATEGHRNLTYEVTRLQARSTAAVVTIDYRFTLARLLNTGSTCRQLGALRHPRFCPPALRAPAE